MPVVAKFCGIVIRMLCLGRFGTRLHAFHGDSEMVLDLATLRIISENVPETVKWMVLAWAKEHHRELMNGSWMRQPIPQPTISGLLDQFA